MFNTCSEEIRNQNEASPLHLHNKFPQITFPAKFAGKFFFSFLNMYHYNDMFRMIISYTMYVR